jgi:ribonuclease Z
MGAARTFPTARLVNGSTGDPVLYLADPVTGTALLFDGGDNCALSTEELGALEAVFVTHHHVDHFIGLDRIVRANIDGDKTLHLFGPEQTIRRVWDRVRSYEYPFFPFMKLRLRVHELLPGRVRVGELSCEERWAEPAVRELRRTGRVCYETDRLRVEAVPVDHTVPCWAYALVEKTGRSRRVRVAFVTDTCWSAAVRPELVKLCQGAERLYCDSFYASAQAEQAAKHKHMMAPLSAELAKRAKVGELVLMHFSTRYAGAYEQLVEEARAVFPQVRAELT